MIEPGHAVVVYLREPREQIWGVLRVMSPVGVTVEGFDVSSFDTWFRDVGAGKNGRQQTSVIFFPFARIERILLDRGSEGVRSMSERFKSQLGLTVAAYLDGRGHDV